MQEQDYLNNCLNKIEKHLQWGNCSNWTNKEYTELSYLINEKTGISLSTSSLRRLFKKHDDSTKPANPQIETKNSLAKFLGYKDWYDFKLQNSETGKKNRINIKVVLIAIVTCCAIALAWVIYSTNLLPIGKPNEKANFKFEGSNLSSKYVPHTVVINYNVKELSKPLYIDWDDVSPDASGGSDYAIISEDSGTVVHTYFFKDNYSIKLLDKDFNALKAIPAIIYTNGWECYAYQGETLVHIDSANFHGKNAMHAAPKYLEAKGIEYAKPYRIIYRNLTEFTNVGKEYSLNVEFKPEFREEYVECGHVQIELIGAEGGNLITFMENGCAGEISAMYLNKKTISGKSNELSDFVVQNNEWASFQFEYKKDSTSIFLNQKSIYTSTSQPSIGKILGVRIEFYGNGIVKNLKLE